MIRFARIFISVLIVRFYKLFLGLAAFSAVTSVPERNEKEQNVPFLVPTTWYASYFTRPQKEGN